MQITGFSVAFGSTRCSGSAGGRAPFAPLARTPRGIRGHVPLGQFVKLDSAKMQFPAFPGPELGNRNYDRNYLFFFDCMHYITK